MSEIETAVILAGGAGLRMLPLTTEIPKALVQVGGKPVIFWVLNWLKKNGIKNIVIGAAYKKEPLIDYLKNNSFGLNIQISEHTIEGETGEGFRLAIERFVKDEDFVAMNGDELVNINLKNLIDFHLKHRPIATIAISPLVSPFGVIDVDKENVVGFREKPIIYEKFVNTGVYIFNQKIKQFLPEKGHIERTTFPLLAERGLVKAYKLQAGERWSTVNTIKDIQHAEEELRLWGWLGSSEGGN